MSFHHHIILFPFVRQDNCSKVVRVFSPFQSVFFSSSKYLGGKFLGLLWGHSFSCHITNGQTHLRGFYVNIIVLNYGNLIFTEYTTIIMGEFCLLCRTLLQRMLKIWRENFSEKFMQHKINSNYRLISLSSAHYAVV